MKRVVIFGAAGHTGKYITRCMVDMLRDDKLGANDSLGITN